MLQVLRDSMKYLAWILWAVIAIFVLFVFVDFGGGVNPGSEPLRAAATVGGEQITYPELDREHRELENQLRQQLGQQFSPQLAEQMRLPMQALNRLISRKVLLAEAARLDLEVSDRELREYILGLPVFQDEAGKFAGKDSYARVVRSLGYTPENFERAMRDQLLLQRLIGAFEGAVVVSDAEVDRRYRQQVERAKLRYVAVSFGEVASELQVTDADLQRWFAGHRDDYRIPEQRVVDFLLVDPRALQDTIEVPEADQRAYYQQNTDEFREDEQVRARHILVDTPEEVAVARARLAAGDGFAKVAGEMSKEPGAAERGGDLGWFGRGRMVPPFEQAAFGARAGELVGPVRTDFGYHLIEVQEKREQRVRPFAEVREAVRLRLQAERAATQAEERARALAAELRKGGANAAQLMRERGGKPGVEMGTTEPFRSQGPMPPLGAAPALNAAAFQLAEGGVSEALRTARGWVVMRLAKIEPTRPAELAEVRERVRQDYEQARLEELATGRLRAARARLDAGATLDEVAAELGAAVQETEEFGHGTLVPGVGIAPELVKAVMGKPEGTIGGPLAVPGKALLYQVVSSRGADPATMATAKKDLRDQLHDEKVNDLLGALINDRKQELGVTYDPPLLERLGMAGGEAQPG